MIIRAGTPGDVRTVARGTDVEASKRIARGAMARKPLAPARGTAAGPGPSIARGRDRTSPAGDVDPDIGSAADAQGVALSAALHAGVALVLSLAATHVLPPPPPPSSAMTVSLVDGEPSASSPTPKPSDPTPPTPATALPAPAETAQPVTAPPTDAAPAAASAPSASPAPAVPDAPAGGARVAIGVKASGADLNPELAAGVGHSVMARLSNCWTRPTDAPAGTTSIVRVRFSQDGSILGDPQIIRVVNQVETPISDPNPWEAAAVDAVRRCSPLGMPSGLYAYWGTVDVQVFS